MLRLDGYFRESFERQFITEGMVDGLLKNGEGHAIERHGPDADIVGRMQGSHPRIRVPPTASRFCSEEDLVQYSHRAVSAGTSSQLVLRDGTVKLTFEYNLGENGEEMLMDYVQRGMATVVHEEEFGSLVRTVVTLRRGQRPVIITSFPVL